MAHPTRPCHSALVVSRPACGGPWCWNHGQPDAGCRSDPGDGGGGYANEQTTGVQLRMACLGVQAQVGDTFPSGRKVSNTWYD